MIIFSSRLIYQECLFFSPKITYITACINSSIIVLCSFLASSKIIEWFKNSNKKVFIIILLCVFLIYPLFFLRSGVIADENHISKKNIWGNSIETYSYSDVEKYEISVKYGIQYDIIFDSENSITLYSHELIILNYFKNEKNLQTFDKLLEKNAKRTVYKSIYSTPNNLKYFFREKEYYSYFNRIFNA